MAGRNLVLFLRLEETIAGLSSPHLKIVALEMDWYMRNQILRDSDWASMAHGLEVRVPFVDICLLQRLVTHLASRNHPTKARSFECSDGWPPGRGACEGEDRLQHPDPGMDEGSNFFRWRAWLSSMGASRIQATNQLKRTAEPDGQERTSMKGRSLCALWLWLVRTRGVGQLRCISNVAIGEDSGLPHIHKKEPRSVSRLMFLTET